jgi:rhodanese-related sulfurtransferase
MASDKISADEANARVLAGEPIVFIDARNPEAWNESDRKIPGAIRMTADRVESGAGEIQRTATVIVYCTCPNEENSSRMVRHLTQKGYRAFALRGGFDAWAAAEYPLEQKLKAA